MMKPKVLCIIQARMGSTRLPGKILKEVDGTEKPGGGRLASLRGTPLLQYEIERVRRAEKVGKIVVATTTEKEDDATDMLCKKMDVDCFRGSEEDVLDRYLKCAERYPEYDAIVRLTGDCPLIDAVIIDELIRNFRGKEADYASNVPPKEDRWTFPDGMDVEVFTRSALTEAATRAKTPAEREHVTLYIRNDNHIKKTFLSAEQNFSRYRLTVDYPEDFEVISFLIKMCPMNAGYKEYAAMLDAHPEISRKNAHIKPNEGLVKLQEHKNVHS